MIPEEKARYDGIVHRLRMAGWSRIDAEDEALARIETSRSRNPLTGQPLTPREKFDSECR